MLKKILLGLVAVLAILAIVISLQPGTYSVSRSTTIKAPPATVFALVNDFHEWPKWSPWEKKDPAMKRTHEGSPAGEGAIYRWDGDGNVGAGDMTIIESKPAEAVKIKLHFSKPFEGTNSSQFVFKPEAEQTTVNWTMAGELNFMSKAIQLFVGMDRMIGPDFEQGLADLKAVAEGTAQ